MIHNNDNMAEIPVHPLIQRLLNLPRSNWRPRRPGNPEALTSVEEKFGVELPEDYRSILLHSDGGSIVGSSAQINLDSIDEIYGQDVEDLIPEKLPGMFVIGGDGCGNKYFYDPENKLGRGKWAVFLVEMSLLEFDHSAFLAASLNELVDRALAGENLRKRLYE